MDSEQSLIRASVIVPVRNGGDDVQRLLEALEAQSLAAEEFEVIIADDGSMDGSLTGVATEDGRIRVLSGPPRNSYAARNRGAAIANGAILAFCDADCRPETTWLETGIARLEHAGVVAGHIEFIVAEARTVWSLLDMDSFLDQERAVRAGGAVTANLLVSRELYERVGGFDDSLPEHGDYDFVARCVREGALLDYAPEVVVRHPTRDQARAFLGKVWVMHRWYAVRESRARRRPEGLKFRSWVPLVQTIRARRRFGRSRRLDRRRLGSNGVRPTLREDLGALPVMYVLLPYLQGAAQLRGWWDGRRLR